MRDVIPSPLEKHPLTPLLRYTAKAKRYPFKQEELGFVKFNITAGECCLASIVATTAC